MYEELHGIFAMPLLITKPPSTAEISDLHYMSFEEAVMHPFTDEHQPSLQNIRRTNMVFVGDVAIGDRDTRSSESEANKLTQSKCILGVVSCKDCMKPRCIYSATLPNRMKPPATNGDAVLSADAIRMCREHAIH